MKLILKINQILIDRDEHREEVIDKEVVVKKEKQEK